VAPNARILASKVCRSDGTCDDFAIQRAIARAVADGANVINMSLGESEYSQSLNDAVQDAWLAGVVIAAGAGNDGNTTPFYPAAFDNVVSVAAFDEDQVLSIGQPDTRCHGPVDRGTYRVGRRPPRQRSSLDHPAHAIQESLETNNVRVRTISITPTP
jgi:subtilisin family serine protease